MTEENAVHDETTERAMGVGTRAFVLHRLCHKPLGTTKVWVYCFTATTAGARCYREIEVISIILL